ncbi:olfactory receptor 4X2-like protein [Corchorus capsularis]|uniref:Olfactory receptor 4X2-like protein n=1 Tax=Corchorus capsularis TaxID=210143 RepID=A0A1R3J8L4_COCAP|nr:olfactory receptor 4X2-like protein [Corchorus capsularis]
MEAPLLLASSSVITTLEPSSSNYAPQRYCFLFLSIPTSTETPLETLEPPPGTISLSIAVNSPFCHRLLYFLFFFYAFSLIAFSLRNSTTAPPTATIGDKIHGMVSWPGCRRPLLFLPSVGRSFLFLPTIDLALHLAGINKAN